MESRNPPPVATRTRLKVAVVATPLLVAVAGLALWFPRAPEQSPTGKAREKSPALSIATKPSGSLTNDGSQTNDDHSQPTIPWIQTVSRLPISLPELAVAHEQAQPSACEAIPVGEQAFSDKFLPLPTDHNRQQPESRPPVLCQRRPVFSVGLDMSKQDQQDLPALSGGQILSYLHENYISLQVRLLKTPASEALFLHHRPLACVTDFHGSAKTEKPTEGMSESLNNYRSLGVFLPEGDLPTAVNLRTLVLLHKGERDQPKDGTNDTFEYVFVRLHPKRSSRNIISEKANYQLSAFATSDDRTQLHCMRAKGSPADVNECSLKSLIRITKYSFGIYPSDSETLSTEFNDESAYAVAELEAYAASQGWQGGLWDNLNQLLDALIDSKLPSQRQSAR